VRHLLGPSFQLYDEQLTSETTLEDILSHRTGIPDYFLLLLAGYPYHVTREQLIQYAFVFIFRFVGRECRLERVDNLLSY